MSDATVRGRFVWHELMTTDTKSAAAFFTKVAAWTTEGWAPDPSYTMFLAKGQPMAGLMALPEDAKAMGAPPNWLSYIGTPNVDETAQQAASLGATIVKSPADIPTIGRFAIIRDPQGAVFAAFTPNRQPQVAGDPVVGDFSWHELATSDAPASFAFYQSLFGWEATGSMDMGPGGTYQMFGWNGKPMGGIYNKSAQMPAPPSWLPYIKVADTKDAVETVKTFGGQILSGPMQVPGGDWIAQGLDLQGAMFAVHSVTPAAAAEPAPEAPSAKTKPAAKAKRAVKKPAARKPVAKVTPAIKAKPAARKKPVVKKKAVAKKTAAAKKKPVKAAIRKRPAARKLKAARKPKKPKVAKKSARKKSPARRR